MLFRVNLITSAWEKAMNELVGLVLNWEIFSGN